MNEQKFSTRQAITLATMFLIGQTLIMYNGMPAKSDIWLSVLAACLATAPLALLAARLASIFPGKNLYDLQIDLFGQAAGRVVCMLYVLFTLHTGSLVLRDMTNFIQLTALTQTPQYVTAVFTVALCIYCVKAGINTLSRYTAMALPVYLLIIVGTTLLSTTVWGRLSHLPPPLYNGAAPMLRSAVSLAAFPFADLVMLPFVLQPLKEHRKAKVIYFTSSGITAALLIMFFVRNMFVLGDNFTYTQYFPGYMAVSLIDIADFLQRIEVVVGAVLFMGAFVKITVYLYVASLGLSKALGFGDYRQFAAPVGMLLAALSLFAYPNIVVNVAFASGIYPYYAFSFRVALPVTVWLMAERKRKKLKGEG
jgi:spore germination protein KB